MMIFRTKITCFATVCTVYLKEVFLTAYHIYILHFLNLNHVAFIMREMHKCMTVALLHKTLNSNSK